jgi:hypothetical protein
MSRRNSRLKNVLPVNVMMFQVIVRGWPVVYSNSSRVLRAHDLNLRVLLIAPAVIVLAMFLLALVMAFECSNNSAKPFHKREPT